MAAIHPSPVYEPTGMGSGRAARRAALAVGLASLLLLATRPAGALMPLPPLTHHMGGHILLMNLGAPLLALLLAGTGAAVVRSGRALAVASFAQIGILWAAHIPSVLDATMRFPALGAASGVLLFVSALFFWACVLAQQGRDRWRGLLALLLTGKLFCLLAALLVLAPRSLYPAVPAHGHLPTHSALADQQLAGLLMIAICPLTYLVAAVIIAARWLRELESGSAQPSRPV
jgi:putative membrane protein